MREQDEEVTKKEGSDENHAPTGNSNRTVRLIVVLSAVLCAATVVLIGMIPFVRAYLTNEPWVVDIIKQHYAAAIGLPLAAALSFMIVIVFEARFDKIEMELFGVVRFKGAAGPIVMWVLCFLSIAGAVKLLW